VVDVNIASSRAPGGKEHLGPQVIFQIYF